MTSPKDSAGMGEPEVSVVVPIHDEEDNIEPLCREIGHAMASTGRSWELLFVDDGSRDRSYERIVALTRSCVGVGCVRLNRNFGQSAALRAGLEASRGWTLVTLDGDRQNDPQDIPRLLERIDQGVDVVCGWRQGREGSMMTRRLPSLVANTLIGALTGVRIHDHGCTLKAFRREVLGGVSLYPGMHRFMVVLMDLAGWRYEEMPVRDRPRIAGVSKYGMARTWRVLLDLLLLAMLSRFVMRPSRWFGLLCLPVLGLTVMALGAVWLRYLQAGRNTAPRGGSTRPSTSSAPSRGGRSGSG